MQKTLALCVNWASGLCANLTTSAATPVRRRSRNGLGTVSERVRNGFGTGSETGPLARPREGLARIELRGRRSTFARSSIDFVAGAALSQGQVSISWQAQHFRKHSLRAGGWQDAENVGAVRELGFRTVRKPPRLRRLYGGGLGTVSERSRNGFGTGSERVRRRAHWHGRAKVSQGLNCVAGAALSQGQVKISWQAQHFRKVKYTFRGRRSTFASTLCELGDGKMQKTLALCVNWASGLCANHLGCDACAEAVSERSRNGLGTGSERVRNGLGDGPIGTAARRFRKV